MDKKFYHKLLVLTVPIAVQSLMLALVAVSDALMLGSIEQDAMSAVSLATQVQFVQNMFLGAITATASILGAQYWGKGDKKALSYIFGATLKLNLLFSVIFFAGCECIPQVLMGFFTNEENLIAIGVPYLRLAGWSYILTGISQSYLTMMKISEHTKQASITSCSVVVLNIVLNTIFIYGLLGIPRMEAEGAAIATLITRFVELVVCVVLSYRKGYLHPEHYSFFGHNRLLLLDYLKCMWPLLGAGLVWGVGFTSYTAFMGHLGGDATAANSVTAVVRDCVCCMCDGLAVGGGILVGNELGAGKLERGKIYGIRLAKMSFILGGISTVIMLGLMPLVRMFVKLTDQAGEYLNGMMVVMAVYMIGRCVNTIVINGIFGAGGDTLFDLYSLIVVMWGIAIPLAAAGTFLFHWHPLLVYACTCLDEVGKIPWVMLHFRKYKWVKDLTRDNENKMEQIA